MTDQTKPRVRRSAEQLAEDHFNSKLDSMTLEEKVSLVKKLKTQIESEVTERKLAAEKAAKAVEGI